MPGERAHVTVTANLRGELDHFSADSVRTMLDELTQDKAVKYLILDMSGMTFMDSSGVGVIIGRYKRMREGVRRKPSGGQADGAGRSVQNRAKMRAGR